VVQDIVTSHMTDLPACHGININPSGRFLSEQLRPDGSSDTGTPAEARDVAMTSLSYSNAWCSLTDKTASARGVNLGTTAALAG